MLFFGLSFIAQGAFGFQDQASLLKEYKIKAALLYNFARFIEWPAEAFTDPNSPLVYAVLGVDPFDTALETIEGKTVRGRKLVIRRIKKIDAIEDCHVLFISTSEKGHLPHILKAVKGMNVITIGEMERFAELGGMINLVKTGTKIKFEINVEAVRESGLKISSNLLKLATIVKNEH